MTILFDAQFMSDLILNAKAIATSFVPLVVFLMSLLVGMSIMHMILAILLGGRRRRVRRSY